MSETKQKTTPEVQAEIEKMMLSNLFSNLYSRWQDESEHEDIREYGVRLVRDERFELVRCTKRPFGVVVTHPEMPGAEYHVTANARSVGWSRLK